MKNGGKSLAGETSGKIAENKVYSPCWKKRQNHAAGFGILCFYTTLMDKGELRSNTFIIE